MIRAIIENHLIPKQDYVYGFADLQGLLPNKYSDYRFGISIGKRLDDKIINNLIDGPTIEYFNHYNNVNKQLAELTKEIQKGNNIIADLINLEKNIKNFGEKNKHSIILLDGIHYLITRYSFEEFIETLYNIIDVIAKNKSILFCGSGGGLILEWYCLV